MESTTPKPPTPHTHTHLLMLHRHRQLLWRLSLLQWRLLARPAHRHGRRRRALRRRLGLLDAALHGLGVHRRLSLLRSSQMDAGRGTVGVLLLLSGRLCVQ